MTTSNTPPDDLRTAEELSRVEAEPLLPIEKQLMAGSLLLGLLLLGLLWWISNRYFPAESKSETDFQHTGTAVEKERRAIA